MYYAFTEWLSNVIQIIKFATLYTANDFDGLVTGFPRIQQRGIKYCKLNAKLFKRH